MPKDPALQHLLAESGPLIAPSANPEGEPPAATIEDARNYFGDQVDLYLDGGTREGSPSTLMSMDEQGAVVVLRAGR